MTVQCVHTSVGDSAITSHGIEWLGEEATSKAEVETRNSRITARIETSVCFSVEAIHNGDSRPVRESVRTSPRSLGQDFFLFLWGPRRFKSRLVWLMDPRWTVETWLVALEELQQSGGQCECAKHCLLRQLARAIIMLKTLFESGFTDSWWLNRRTKANRLLERGSIHLARAKSIDSTGYTTEYIDDRGRKLNRRVTWNTQQMVA